MESRKSTFNYQLSGEWEKFSQKPSKFHNFVSENGQNVLITQILENAVRTAAEFWNRKVETHTTTIEVNKQTSRRERKQG